MSEESSTGLDDVWSIHYAKPRTIVNNHTNTGEHNTCFKYTEFYVNNTSQIVTVTNNTNLPIMVKPNNTTQPLTDEFIVRRVYSFASNDCIKDTITVLDTYRRKVSEDNEDLNIILNALTAAFNHNRFAQLSIITIDKCISVETLAEKEWLYLNDNNLILQLGSYNPKIVHPLSSDTMSKQYYKELLGNKVTTGVFVELIDNNNQLSSRYMYLGNSVIEIPRVKDITREDGCYFTTVESNSKAGLESKTVQLSYDEAVDKIGLYSSKEEARTKGNPEYHVKSKLKNLEISHIEARSTLEVDKATTKASEVSLIKELNKLKHDLEIRELELKASLIELKEESENRREERKDRFEDKSYKRKTSSEVLKYAPTVIAGILGLYTLLNKRE